MSEHVPLTPEHAEIPSTATQPEAPPVHEHVSKSQESHTDNLETIRRSVEQAATQSKTERSDPQAEAATQSSQPTYVNKELKSIALQRSLQRIRRQLPAPSRLLSKFIHQPAIRRASAVGGATIARPSGLLGGGFCAFLGSLVYLYFTKHLGYEYNYLLFVVFLGSGFALGLLLELVVYLIRKLASR